MFTEKSLSGGNSRSGWITLALGALLAVAVMVVGVLYYIKEVKPRQTEAQRQVQKFYTFSLTCVVQEPMKGVYRPWLVGVSGQNAWTYEIPCVSTTDAEVVSNGVENLLPKPGAGLHFVTVADSALVSDIYWLHEWQEVRQIDLSQEENVKQTITLPSFNLMGMKVYELFLKPQYQDGKLKMNFLCHEEFNPTTRLVKYLCSSD